MQEQSVSRVNTQARATQQSYSPGLPVSLFPAVYCYTGNTRGGRDFTLRPILNRPPPVVLTPWPVFVYSVPVHCTIMSPPAIRINVRSAVPAYRQIVDGLRARLVEGALPPGHVLPPVRRLALELGVHFNTVAQAYRELADEGWLDLKHGRGATVVERKPAAKPRQRDSRVFRERLRELVAQIRADGLPAARVASELKLLAESLDK
jgi:GntR family transcriptional regulator